MIRVNRVTVYPLYVRLKVGEWYYDASATVCPANADCCGVTWHSSDTSVASVHPTTGVIHGVSEGTATIYATSTDGSNVSDSLGVVVEKAEESVKVDSVTLNKSHVTLNVCDEEHLIATVSPCDASDPSVSWESSNESVAKVYGNGNVRAISKGYASITATANDGSGKSASCGINVGKVLKSTASPTGCSLNGIL